MYGAIGNIMTLKIKPSYVIAYDIRSNKSRRKIAKLLTDCGLKRVNKSVYEGSIPQNRFSSIIEVIYSMLSKHDDVLIYPISTYGLRKKIVLRKRKSNNNEKGPIII